MNNSNHDDIRDALESTKCVALKEHELASGRALLADYLHEHAAIAPWYIRLSDSSTVRFSGAHISSFQTVGSALVLVLMLGSGTSYAAEGALPGDLLYPVKKVVNEGVRAALAVTPEARVQWQTARTSRRLAEAQTLVAHNDLTPEKVALIEDDISDAAVQIRSARAEAAVTLKPEAVDTKQAMVAVATSTSRAVESEPINLQPQDKLNDESEDSKLSVRVQALEAISTSTSEVSTTTREAITSIVGRVRGHFQVKKGDEDISILASSSATSSDPDSRGGFAPASKGAARAGATMRVRLHDNKEEGSTEAARIKSATSTIILPGIIIHEKAENSSDKGRSE